MNIDAIKNQIPDYAKDLRVNFKNIFSSNTSAHLSEEQIYATALATAIASGNARFARDIENLCKQHISDAVIQAAKSASAIMAMNNVYYRFLHLSGNPGYQKLPAKLRMQVIAKPGVSKTDFELYSLAVSAVHGCGLCIDSHEKILIDNGVSEESIQDAVRIAAVMHAVARTLDFEV
ncbi:MAG: alkyl hydroperoxide reductase, partial [Gammaproteobacteria bacterium]|nr:alkyl hydroperoxide reductase [Gammaproteobacteria bacterium]